MVSESKHGGILGKKGVFRTNTVVFGSKYSDSLGKCNGNLGQYSDILANTGVFVVNAGVFGTNTVVF